MDSPVPTSLTPDPQVSASEIGDKVSELLSAAERPQAYHGLINLPIHFAVPNALVVNQNNTDEGNNVGVARPNLHTALLDNSVYERWRHFGHTNGLHTDSLVASFLLQHYETSSSLPQCAGCQVATPVYCTKCALQPGLGLNPPPSANPHTTLLPRTSASPQPSSATRNGDVLNRSLAARSLPSYLLDSGDGGGGLATTSLADLQANASGLISEAKTRSANSTAGTSVINASSSPRKSKAGDSSSCGSVHNDDKKGTKKKKKGQKVKVKKEPYTCTECGTHIAPKPKSPSSQRKSGGVHPYRCSVCNQSFAYRRLLESHLFSQENTGGWKCRHCHLLVLNPGDIRRHCTQHTAEMPFKCPHCPLAFSLACNLKTHLRTHSGERPFVCGVCNRAFTQSIALKVHLRKHTGERPFPCPHCPMAFAASSNLSRHVLKHTGQKPYRCAFCSAAFSQPGSLKTHTRSKHTGERPYVCQNCSAAFSDHSTLWKHRRNNSCHSNHGAGSNPVSGSGGGKSRKQAGSAALSSEAQNPRGSGRSAPSLLAPTPPQTVVVSSQGHGLTLTPGVPSVAVTAPQPQVQPVGAVSMSVLTAAAAAVVNQQPAFRPQQQPLQQPSHINLHAISQHLQVAQLQPQQQSQQEQHQPMQVQQHPSQQQPAIEEATFVNGVGWCFPLPQQ